MTNKVFVPMKVIPAHTIENCSECDWFIEWGGSYGEYHKCGHIDGPVDRVTRDGIPDECPLLVDHTT